MQFEELLAQTTARLQQRSVDTQRSAITVNEDLLLMELLSGLTTTNKELSNDSSTSRD